MFLFSLHTIQDVSRLFHLWSRITQQGVQLSDRDNKHHDEATVDLVLQSIIGYDLNL